MPNAHSEPRSLTSRGRLLVFGAAFFWGTSATLARFVFHERAVPALHVVEIRLVVAAVLLGSWLRLKRPELLRVAKADWRYLAILGTCGVAAMQGSYYHSISVLGVGLAILLQYLAPVLLVLYDTLRGKRLQGRTLVTVLAAVVGTALVVGDVDARALHAEPIDWAVGFGSAVVFAFYITYSKRGLERYAPETLLFYAFSIAAIFWAVVTPPWQILAAGYGSSLWLMFLVLGVCSTLVPFALFNGGLRTLSPADTAIVATLEPVVAVLSAWIFLGESLTPLAWIGATLVVVASALPSLDTRADHSPKRH